MTSSSTTAERPSLPGDATATRGGRLRHRSRPALAVAAALGSALVLGAAALAVWVQRSTRTAPTPTPCALTAEAEGCWEERTGVPGWTGEEIVAGRSPLIRVDGDIEIEVDGTVLRDRWVEGCIAVRASNVTIENVLVRSDHGCSGGRTPSAPALISSGENGGGGISGLVVRDTEIDGLGAPGDVMAIGQTAYTCIRCDIHGTAKGAKADQDVIVVDSYIHDLAFDGATHTEAFFFDGGAGRIRVERNWMRANAELSTAALALLNDWPGRDVVVRGNYLDGHGAVAVVGGAVADKPAPPMQGIVIEGNVLAPLSMPDGVHHVHSFDPTGPGNRWTDNRDAVTGDLVALPGP